FDDAEYYSLKALAYSHEYDDPSDIIFAYRFLSKINANRNQFNKANAYLDTAKMVAKDYKLPYMLPGITVFQIANEIELENYQKVGELIHFIDTLQVGN